MMRTLEGAAKKLSAYIGENAEYDGKALYTALVEAARTVGCAGATVLRGVDGFGATSRIHAAHNLRMSSDLPVVVQVIDVESKVIALSEVFRAMVGDGLITIEDIFVVQYQGGVTGGPGKTSPGV
jgi:PII-like signaling protein